MQPATAAVPAREGDGGDPGLRKAVLGSMAGTAIEWYDFLVYSTASGLVFGKIFFPEGDPWFATLSAFVTVAVGFVARPVGAVVLGYYGDVLGRKRVLQMTLLIIGLSTFLVGCLPTYQSIGIAAPIALIILRFAQGFAIGGEWGGATLLVAERAPDHRRGFYTTLAGSATAVGNIAGVLVLLLLSSAMAKEDFLSWGWRIAFWLSVVIVAVGAYVRRQVEESAIFQEASRRNDEARLKQGSLIEVIRGYPRELLVGITARLGENTIFGITSIFTVSYLNQQVGLSSSEVLFVTFVASVTTVIPVIGAGWLADRFGRRPVFLTGAIALLLWSPFYFPLLDTGRFWIIMAVMTFAFWAQALCIAVQSSMLPELFPTRLRYIASGFAYHATSIAAGSVAPIIAVWLLSRFGSTTPIILYMMAALCVSIFGVGALYRRPASYSLRAIDEADLRKAG
ncbi:hypothetical protein A8O16_20460 [Sphingobium sp. 20006FA]|nr:hypothetical protein A8O16_20460 [Sphingobium sp. 20006FA]